MSWIDDFNRGQMRAGTALENPFATGGERAGQDFAGGGGGSGGGGGGCGIVLLPLILGGMIAWPAAAICSVVTFPVIWVGAALGGRRAGPWRAYKTSAIALGFGLLALTASLSAISAGAALFKPPMTRTGPIPMTGWSAVAHDWFSALARCVLRVLDFVGQVTADAPPRWLVGVAGVSPLQGLVAVLLLGVVPVAAHAFGLARTDPAAFGAGNAIARYATATANLAAVVLVVPWIAVHLLAMAAPH